MESRGPGEPFSPQQHLPRVLSSPPPSAAPIHPEAKPRRRVRKSAELIPEAAILARRRLAALSVPARSQEPAPMRQRSPLPREDRQSH